MAGNITHTENIEIDISIEIKCHSCGKHMSIAYENQIDNNNYEVSVEKCKCAKDEK